MQFKITLLFLLFIKVCNIKSIVKSRKKRINKADTPNPSPNKPIQFVIHSWDKSRRCHEKILLPRSHWIAPVRNQPCLFHHAHARQSAIQHVAHRLLFALLPMAVSGDFWLGLGARIAAHPMEKQTPGCSVIDCTRRDGLCLEFRHGRRWHVQTAQNHYAGRCKGEQGRSKPFGDWRGSGR